MEEKGIIEVTRGKMDISIPPNVSAGEVWRYGVGFPMQLSPDTAGLFTTVRLEKMGVIDFEKGTDLILFDDINNISADNAIALSRLEKGPHERIGDSAITIKFPVRGGFVPLGAKREDGSPHPHAGTGFGVSETRSFPLQPDGRYDHRHPSRHSALERFQFAYDGKEFSVLKHEKLEGEALLPGWQVIETGLTNAIAVGDDLLFPMSVQVGDMLAAGVMRWRRQAEDWDPLSFVPLTGNGALKDAADLAGDAEGDIYALPTLVDDVDGKGTKRMTWHEPTVIRDVDGSLLASARGTGESVHDIAIWRSEDDGETWKEIIRRKKCRASSPVSLNQAADGTPYVVANLPPRSLSREILCMWPMNAERSDFEEEIILRDCRAEFGAPPSGSAMGSCWMVDHTNAATLRFADGKWHNVLVYRIVDYMEIGSDADPTAQSGCYLEEVLSRGEPRPIWNF